MLLTLFLNHNISLEREEWYYRKLLKYNLLKDLSTLKSKRYFLKAPWGFKLTMSKKTKQNSETQLSQVTLDFILKKHNTKISIISHDHFYNIVSNGLNDLASTHYKDYFPSDSHFPLLSVTKDWNFSEPCLSPELQLVSRYHKFFLQEAQVLELDILSPTYQQCESWW